MTSAVETFALVTGGGTAGHVLPALAVAEGLVSRGHRPSTIHYVGAERGIETRLVADTPFPHTFFDVVGLQRSLTRRNLGVVPKLLVARRRAIELCRRQRPQVVVSVGGYASVPAVLAARKLDIPIVVVSYDLRPGRASQLAARHAAACAVAFPGSPLPRAVMTGAPIRRRILDVDRQRDRAAARHELGLPPDRFVIAAMGGSQGSGALNEAVFDLVGRHADDRGLAIRHVVGERFVDRAPPELAGAGATSGIVYQPVGYEERMPLVYAAADLLIGRGGASTVHEVAATGIPAILVPWAGAAEDHQTTNVRWLADIGGAVHLPESEIDRLDERVVELLVDHQRRSALSAAAREVGELHRTGAIAELVDWIASGRDVDGFLRRERPRT